MAESYGGGFAGDRAGLMNLENVLGGITQNAMQNRMFNSQMAQQAFERQMAQQQFGLQQKQFALAKQIEPWEAIGNLLGWETQGAQREPLAQDFYRMMQGLKPNSTVPGENTGLPPTPTSSFADRHPGMRLGLDAIGGGLGGLVGGYLMKKPLWGAGIGGGIVDFGLNQIGKQPVLPANAPMSTAMGMPPLPPDASVGIPSISPQNVNKRNARKAGGSTGAAVKPPATMSANAWAP